MSGFEQKKPSIKAGRGRKKQTPVWDILKVFLLAGVIFLAGWGISVRGERLQQAEMLAEISQGGAVNADQLREIKWMIDKGELQGAIVRLRSIIRADDQNAVAHYFLGIAFAKRGLSAEALAEFERTVELGGWAARAYYNMGVIYESLGFYDKAYSVYESARALDPQNRDYERARDKVGYVVGADMGVKSQYQLRFNEASQALVRVPPDLEFASNTFEHLSREFPSRVEPLHMLGVVRSKQGKLDEAEEIFLLAINLEPGYMLSYYNLGIIYQTTGRWTEARDIFMRCLNLVQDGSNREIISSHIRQVDEKIIDLD